MFALGTFMNSVTGERTEHANNLDHTIALHLLNSVLDDASPLVRRELVVALHYVVKTFEANFVTICRITLEEQKSSGVTASVLPNVGSSSNLAGGGLRRVSSREGIKITPSVSSPSLDKLGGSNANLNR